MKKIFFLLAMITVIAVSVYSLVFMYSNEDSKDVKIDLELIKEIEQSSLDTFEVKVGNISREISLNAVVDSREDCFLDYPVVIGEKDKYDISVSAGMKVKEGDELYTLNNKKITAEKDGQCLGVEADKEGFNIKIFYYENVAVRAYLPSSLLNRDITSMDIVFYIGSEGYKMELLEILTETEDGCVAALFVPEDKTICAFPGTSGEMRICIEKKENVLLVPISYIEYEGGDNFAVCVSDAEGTSYVPVSVGIVGEDYAEITEGLVENASVVCPADTLSLEYYIKMNGWNYID